MSNYFKHIELLEDCLENGPSWTKGMQPTVTKEEAERLVSLNKAIYIEKDEVAERREIREAMKPFKDLEEE